MITEGGSRSNKGGFFSWELDDQVANEKNELVAVEGVCPGSAKGMLRDFKAMAAGFNGDNYICHFSQNNKGDRKLTELEELRASHIAREKLGLLGMPFFIKRHTHSDGSSHIHTVVLRVKDGKAVNDDYNDANTMYLISREIEKEFDLRRIEDVPARSASARGHKKWQTMKAGNNGISLDELDLSLQSLKATCKTGQDFVDGLKELSVVLAQGDKVKFFTVDQTGTAHKLRVQLGLKQSQLDSYMSGVDHRALPTLKEARAMQSAAQKIIYGDEIKSLWKQHHKSDALTLVKAINDSGYVVAKAKKSGVYLCVARSGNYISLQRAAGVGKTTFDKFMHGLDRNVLPDVKQARAMQASKKPKSTTGAFTGAAPAFHKPRNIAPQNRITSGQHKSRPASPAPQKQSATSAIADIARPVTPAARPAASHSEPAPVVHFAPQTPELQNMPDRKPRVVTPRFSPADRPTAASIMQDYAHRIEMSAKYTPDALEGLEKERDGLIAALEDEAKNEFHNYQVEAKAIENTNRAIDREEFFEDEKVQRENNIKIAAAKIPPPPPRPIKPSM